jgi:uncharacterized protein
MIQKLNIPQYPVPLRLVLFLLLVALLWIPRAAIAYFLFPDPNLRTIITMGLLFGDFIFLQRWWGVAIYRQRGLIQSYGLVGTRRNGFELLMGLGFGVLLTFTLFIVEGICGWVIWQYPENLSQFILEGFLCGLGVGFAEELVFRGWLLNEFERDYSLSVSLVVNSLLFAILHFIKPLPVIVETWPQFPGLLLLGLILVNAKRLCQNRLGISIGFHGGLVWGYYIINVGKLVKYSGSAPAWLTGINGNPLAGILGLGFLSVIVCFLFIFRAKKSRFG